MSQQQQHQQAPAQRLPLPSLEDEVQQSLLLARRIEQLAERGSNEQCMQCYRVLLAQQSWVVDDMRALMRGLEDGDREMHSELGGRRRG